MDLAACVYRRVLARSVTRLVYSDYFKHLRDDAPSRRPRATTGGKPLPEQLRTPAGAVAGLMALGPAVDEPLTAHGHARAG